MAHFILKHGTNSILHLKQIFILFILIFLANSGFGQIAGSTSTFTTNLTFQENVKGVTLDPTPLIGTGSRVSFQQNFSNSASPDLGMGIVKNILGNNDISIPGWLTDLTSGVGFFCSGISPSFSANASVDVGGYYEIHSVGKADISLNYPIKVSIVYPEQNTFACGNTIKIETSYTVLDPNNSNKLKVKPPFFNQEIGPLLDNLSFNTSFGIDAWVGFGIEVPYPCKTGICYKSICSDKKYFNESKSFSLSPSLPNLPPILNICEGAFGSGANNATLLSCNWSAFSPMLKLGQNALDTYNQQYHTNYTLASFPNQSTVVIAPPDFPSASNAPTIPEIEATFKNVENTELSFQSLNGGKKLRVSGIKESVSKMNVDLISFLDYTKLTTSYSLGGGLGSVDIGDVSPTFTANQNMSFEFKPIVNLVIDLGAEMNYSVHNQNGTVTYSSFGQYVELIAGQYIMADFPQNCSSPIEANWESNLNGEFKSRIEQQYFESYQIKLGEVDIPGYLSINVVDEEIAKSKFDEDVILNHQILLETNSIISLPKFILDPENPIINIDYVNVEDVLNLGGGEKAVVYKLGITNEGDVTLSDLRLDFNLGETFQNASGFSVECLSSDDFTLNNGFDGQSVINLLSTGNSLDSGESGFLEVLVKVKPEISNISSAGCFEQVNYFAKAKAYGVSPIGTHVENNFNQCTGEITGSDIIASVDLGASVITGINDFVIYGFNRVKFDKPQGMSMGNIGSRGDVIFENSSLQNSNSTVIIGDVHAGGQIFIQGESKVEVDYISVAKIIKSPNWKSALTLNGALSESSNCVATQPSITIDFPKIESKKSVIIKKGKSKLLVPGDYKSVTLSEGSEIVLGSGTYNIGRWAFLGNDATISYQILGGQVVLNLETWQPLGRENLQFIINGGDVNDVIYNYKGKQKCAFNSSMVRGNIYAPNAEVEFSNGSILEGVCYAEKVNFKTGSFFKGLKYLEPLNISSECQNILIPGEQSMYKSGVIGDSWSNDSEFIQLDKEVVKIYPNPTKDFVIITGLPENKNLDISIFNSTGQIVRQLKNTTKLLKVDLADQPSGIYYIRVNGMKLDPIIRN